MVPEVGIAPTSPRLQRGANLPQLLGVMARRAEAQRAKAGRPGKVMLLRLPVISRVLCF
jgi:hypothetical protein